MNILDYKVDTEYNNFNSYSYISLVDSIAEDELEYDGKTYLLKDFKYLTKTYSKHLDINTEIVKFTLLEDNWDGYGAVPLTNTVAEKSRAFIENLNLDIFEKFEFDIRPTPYSTLLIDWFKGDNVFSLEIGKDSIGYFSDGQYKLAVPELSISSIEETLNAVNKVESDFKLSIEKIR